ncbi:S8 family peptidase [Actinotalea subterranea]|uniref:S8 family peptidase n=1 Tax=Actinotalea subterranea TaxID=2607497 RepID=UPI0011EC8686|nr:S8 family peptidase [Actinotalea subterranea]
MQVTSALRHRPQTTDQTPSRTGRRLAAGLAAGVLLASSGAFAGAASATVPADAASGGARAEATAGTPGAAPPPGEAVTPDPGVTDRLIVKYRTQGPGGAPGATTQEERRDRIQTAAQSVGASVEHVRRTGQGAEVWSLGTAVPEADVAAIAAEVAAADPTVEYAEPDRILHPLAAAPNDPRWSELWALQTSSVGINVLSAWDTTRGAGVNVAVIDTGYRPHADLAANVVGGYDMIADTSVSNDGNGRDADAADPGDHTAANQCGAGEPATASSWHGTHVAGTIAAVAGNGAGVAGVAPAAKVVPLRVLGTCGGYTSDIADAMVWASGGTVTGVPANPNRARVLNLSLGGSGTCDTTSQRAITTARANGAVVVVAAGNENRDVSQSSPANCSGVVAVAAYGPTGARAYYSNYGSLVDVAAPGGDQSGGSSRGILSTLNAGTAGPGADSYAYFQGTSMATPHVAAVAALMLSANSALTPDQVETMLRSTARPFVATCSGCGAGMLDAAAAVAAAKGGGTTTPPPTGTEAEPNNTRGTANAVGAPSTVSAAIGSSSDTDYFAVSLPAGATLTATLTPGSTSADYDLYLYNASGSLVASSELGAGRADAASTRNAGSTTATYYARVAYYSGGTGAGPGAYSLALGW